MSYVCRVRDTHVLHSLWKLPTLPSAPEDGLGPRGGPHERQDLPHLWREAHVEHAVCLVEHEVPSTVRFALTAYCLLYWYLPSSSSSSTLTVTVTIATSMNIYYYSSLASVLVLSSGSGDGDSGRDMYLVVIVAIALMSTAVAMTAASGIHNSNEGAVRRASHAALAPGRPG